MSEGKTVGITGASGALGKELTKIFRKKGYKVTGFTPVSYTHLTLPTKRIV